MQRTKTLAAILAFALIVAAGCYAAWTATVRAAPVKAAETYIRALAEGNTEAALQSSTGTAAWAVKNTRSDKARIVVLDTAVPEAGKDYAEVLVYAELELADGSRDAGWYRLTLTRTDRWRVVSVLERLWSSGPRRTVSRHDQQEMARSLEGYLSALAQGDHREAVRRLCGPARRAHEQGEGMFKHLPVENIGPVEVTPVWRRGNQAVCRAEYELDGRRVSVLVRYAKLGDGWRIAAVNQV